jgi:hypothetical protein
MKRPPIEATSVDCETVERTSDQTNGCGGGADTTRIARTLDVVA